MSLTLAPRATAPAAISLPMAIAATGGVFYGVLLWVSVQMNLQAFGYDFYDQVWLALREGRLDLPIRVLRIEGHYTADGTAYFYHGLAPLVIRALLDPLIQIGQVSLSPLSIWLWTVLGTALYHTAFLRVIPEARTGLRAALSALLWFGGPGVILAGNHAFYHEPISLGYALGGGFVLLWVRAVQAGRMSVRTLLGLALLAALCVHARPNLAAALYIGVGLAALWALWSARLRMAAPVLLAALVLGGGGYSYLALNEARFGDKGMTHGTFEESPIRYGMMFWGKENKDSLRARAFMEHGRFNLGRVLPSALAYLALPPEQWSAKAHGTARNLHFKATASQSGFTRIETPTSGLLFLWTSWIILAAFGIARLRHATWAQLALVATTGASAVLMLSYAAITLRYMLALWPLIAVLSLIGLPRAAQALGGLAPVRIGALGAAVTMGVIMSLQTAGAYRFEFREETGTFFEAWDTETCRAHVLNANLPADRVTALCRAPRVET